MRDRRAYSKEEEGRLIERIRRGEPSLCPRCGGALSTREILPPEEVAYVRDRIWLVCGPCGRSAVLDRRKLEG